MYTSIVRGCNTLNQAHHLRDLWKDGMFIIWSLTIFSNYIQAQNFKVIPDNQYYTSFLRACVDSKDFETGRQVLAHMNTSQIVIDPILRVMQMQVYVAIGEAKSAMSLWKELRAREMITKPQILNAAIVACTETRDLATGRSIHKEIEQMQILHAQPFIASALITMYGKCGDLASAEHVSMILVVGQCFAIVFDSNIYLELWQNQLFYAIQ